MMVAWLLGLAIAWKWELFGGVMALGAVFIAAIVNWRVMTFPGALIVVTAVLYLASWWMRRVRPGDATEVDANGS